MIIIDDDDHHHYKNHCQVTIYALDNHPNDDQVTHSRHYESFRCSKLQEMMHSVGGKVRIVIIIMIQMTRMMILIMMLKENRQPKVSGESLRQ